MKNLEKVYLDKNIWYIENFISDDEINKVLSMNLPWQEDYTGEGYHSNRLTATITDTEDGKYFAKTIQDKIRVYVDNDNQSLKHRNMLTKHLPVDEYCKPNCNCEGFDLSWHYENHPQCDYESRWITLGVCLYFNDDYDGGEIVFQNKPIEIKPKKGMLIVFPATEEYSHGVRSTKGKERVVFATFVYSKAYWDILYRSGWVDMFKQMV